MAQKDIYKLVDELVKKVEFLEEKLIKQQRENADLMEQMSKQTSSGVSSSFVGQVDKKFSEIMQTEEKIQMTVADVSDEARKQYSKYEQTAQEIKTEVADLSGEVDVVAGDISEVVQTASSISSTVTKIYGEAAISDTEPTNTGDFNKEKMYLYNGTFYYYNDVLKEWVAADSKSVFSQILQTKDGVFVLGNVKVSGNQIVEGTITGTEIELGKNEFLDTIRLEMVEGVPRLAFYHSGGLLGYISSQDAGRVLFQSAGGSEIGFGGKADFSVATVTGLYAVFE